YEDAYIEKWVSEYNFDADIIEEALRRTTSAQSPSFEYINSILTNWHEKGYKSKEEILAAENAARAAKQAKPRTRVKSVPQKGNFEQRKYDDEYFEKLYKDV